MPTRDYIRRSCRKIYRFLRHPRRRKASRLHDWVARRVFARSLWRPCMDSVARGFALGLVIAMCPVPLQMLIAGVVISHLHFSVGMRLNLPAAVVGTWTSNFATIVPLCAFQLQVGRWIEGWLPWLSEPTRWDGAVAMVLGVATTAVIAGAAGYLVVVCFWDAISRRIAHPLGVARQAG